MAKLKKSEQITAEREREIKQVTGHALTVTEWMLNFKCPFNQLSSFDVGCGIGERACPDHEGPLSPCYRSG